MKSGVLEVGHRITLPERYLAKSPRRLLWVLPSSEKGVVPTYWAMPGPHVWAQRITGMSSRSHHWAGVGRSSDRTGGIAWSLMPGLVKIVWPFDLAISFIWIYVVSRLTQFWNDVYKQNYCKIIYKLKATYMSISWELSLWCSHTMESYAVMKKVKILFTCFMKNLCLTKVRYLIVRAII